MAALSRAAGENVGSYAIGQGSLAANSNYTVAYTGANLGIRPATLTPANAPAGIHARFIALSPSSTLHLPGTDPNLGLLPIVGMRAPNLEGWRTPRVGICIGLQAPAPDLLRNSNGSSTPRGRVDDPTHRY